MIGTESARVAHETRSNAIAQFYTAVKEDQAELVRTLLVTGKVDVDYVFKHNGYTALQMAVRDKLYNVFNVLLELGCSVNVVDANGWTALAFACHSDSAKLPFIEKLLAYRADPYVRCKLVGWTALHVSTSTRNEAALRLLIKHGVDLNVTSNNLLTPLHIAIRSQWLKGAELLVKNFANPAVKDRDGFSALYYASICFGEVSTRLRLLRLMLACGCNIDRELWVGNLGDQTPILKCGVDEEVMRWLQERKSKKRPPRLQSLCRNTVRRHLHPLADEKIAQLVSIVPHHLIVNLQMLKV